MTDGSGIKVTGLKSSIKALQAIGVPDAAIKEAGSRSGEIVATEARTLVPVLTGRLRDSIRVSKALARVSISAGGARVPYANPIHWGWYKRNIRPNPFFVGAIGTTRDEVYRTYYAQLDKLIAANSTKGTEE